MRGREGGREGWRPEEEGHDIMCSQNHVASHHS